MKRRIATTLIILMLTMGLALSTLAQNEDGLTLSLARDWGYSSGTGRIQGRFSIRVTGPANLTRVVFLIDNKPIGEDSQAPFRFQFRTGDYSLGVHTLSAIGYLDDGRQLYSNQVRREFVSAEESWKSAVEILVPIFSITFAIILLAFVLPLLLGRNKRVSLPPGAQRNYGFFGGTICPKCGRPFSLHFWSLNLGFRRLDRCPFCGRWSVVRALPLQELRAAEEAEREPAPSIAPTASLPTEERLRKELDDSRYLDV